VTDTADGDNNGITSVGDSVTVSDSGGIVFPGSGIYTVVATTTNGVVIRFNGNDLLLSTVAYFNGNAAIGYSTTGDYTYCFLSGTQIVTPEGEVPVENLKTDDLVTTHDGRAVPVKWVGEQRVKNWMFTSADKAPVCITKGALGNGLPHTDLFVSADHGMVLDGLVINASALVNHTTIRFVPMAEMPPEFTYYHVETEAHDAILANGAAAETLIDYKARKDFDNYAEYEELYGAERVIPDMNRSRISSRRLVPDALKARLDTGPDWDVSLNDPEMTVTLKRGLA
jgi:hypothetical protein